MVSLTNSKATGHKTSDRLPDINMATRDVITEIFKLAQQNTCLQFKMEDFKQL